MAFMECINIGRRRFLAGHVPVYSDIPKSYRLMGSLL